MANQQQPPQQNGPSTNSYQLERPEGPQGTEFGIFAWEKIGTDKTIPVIYRGTEKFVSVEMANVTVLQGRLIEIPLDLYNCAWKPYLAASPREVQLLNLINREIKGIFGEPFRDNEMILITHLEELRQLCKFLDFAHAIIYGDVQSVGTWCGFLKINAELIPAAVKDGEIIVPTMHFKFTRETHSEYIRRSKSVDGWSVAYLRVCCRVSLLKYETISVNEGTETSVFNLQDLRALYPGIVIDENLLPVTSYTANLTAGVQEHRNFEMRLALENPRIPGRVLMNQPVLGEADADNN